VQASTEPKVVGDSAGCGNHRLPGRPAGGLRAAWERGPVVLDAAAGTRLVAQGLLLGSDDPALWNLAHPGDVVELHRRDVAAGAGAIVTNTFGANRCWLAKFASQAMVESINRRAVELAREAAGTRTFVIGGLGPTAREQSGALAEQAAVLLECGVDAILLETFRALEIERVLDEVAPACAAAVPILVSLWEWPRSPAALARRLIERGALVLGMNCQVGIEAAIAFAEAMSTVVSCPLLVKPAAGQGATGGSSPEAFAAAVPRLLAHNVRLVGGCCGTTENHVAALAGACAVALASPFATTGA
jgi:methionine synthase I (cobalamin-dependent)